VLGEYPHTLDPSEPHLDDELLAALKSKAYGNLSVIDDSLYSTASSLEAYTYP
jgi:hypothetical protein